MDHNIMQIQRAAAQQPPSPYHVYPLAHNPIQHAFQIQGSPLLATKRQQLMEMTNQMMPQSRDGTPSMRHVARTAIQETSFITDTEEQVQKINAMFPTVPIYHIRTLMKKYYNREAVVISKLQVEKYPLTTPGPQTPQLSMKYPSVSYQMTPPLGFSSSSPVPRPSSSLSGISYSPATARFGYQSSPKPHSSPKMKLRYMKSLYPAAEETLILDILAGSDNNVQKTSEKLKALGYEKRDRLSLRRKKELEEEQKKEETIIVVRVRAKTNEDKLNLKLKLQGLYKDIPEKIVVMACDSVNYDEGRAIQILNIVVDDNDNDLKNVKQKTDADDNDDLSSRGNSLKSRHSSETTTASVKSKYLQHAELPQYYQNNNKNEIENADENKTPDEIKSVEEECNAKPEKLSRPKIKNGHSKNQEVEKVTDEMVKVIAKTKCYKSMISRPNAVGANSQLKKGQNEDLLLADYVTWNGSSPNFARGANKDICKGRKITATGPNVENCKGSRQLPKGSIYQKIQLICN